jgi:DNA polymerase-3 subunit epsilon
MSKPNQTPPEVTPKARPEGGFYDVTTPFPCWQAYYLYSGVEPIPKITTPAVAFFDLESTGLDPEEDRIVDLAVCIRRDGREEWKERLINPERPIPPEASKIHGITDEMVKDCLPFRAVARSLATLLEGACLVAHNARGYDVPMIVAEFRRAGITFEPAQVIDTLPVARQRLPRRRSYRLQDIAKDLGFPERSAHRARPDVETMMDLWKVLITRDSSIPAGI